MCRSRLLAAGDQMAWRDRETRQCQCLYLPSRFADPICDWRLQRDQTSVGQGQFRCRNQSLATQVDPDRATVDHIVQKGAFELRGADGMLYEQGRIEAEAVTDRLAFNFPVADRSGIAEGKRIGGCPIPLEALHDLADEYRRRKRYRVDFSGRRNPERS